MFQVRYLPLLLTLLWLCAIIICTCVFWGEGEAFSLYWPDYCQMYSDKMEYITKVTTACVIYVPLCLISVMYLAIYVVVRRSAARVGVSHKGSKDQKNNKMALILFILFIMFTVAYVPYTTYPFVREQLSVEAQRVFLVTTMYSAIGMSALNPIVYGLIFKPIKQVYVKSLRCGKQSNNVESMGTSAAA